MEEKILLLMQVVC